MANLSGGNIRSTTPFQLYRRLALAGDGAAVQTITAAVTVTPQHEEIIILNPSTGTRVVTLPTAAAGAKKGEMHLIYNAGSTYNLTINKPASTTLATLLPGDSCIVVFAGSAWTLAMKAATSATSLAGTAAITTETDAPGASTAAAGANNGDAAALPSGTAKVYPTTGADDTKGVIVSEEDNVAGRLFFIGNGVFNKQLKVYPPSGGSINGAGSNAAFLSSSGKGVVMYCLTSGGSSTWLAW